MVILMGHSFPIGLICGFGSAFLSNRDMVDFLPRLQAGEEVNHSIQ